MERWSGPPPLLIAATLLGVLLAPTVSAADDARPHAQRAAIVARTTPLEPTASPTSPAGPVRTEGTESAEGTGRTEDIPTAPPSAPGDVLADRTDGPAAEPPGRPMLRLDRTLRPARRQLLGLATFNQDRSLSLPEAREDARAIARRKGVTIVGWQEGERFGPVYSMLKRQGWDTLRSLPAAPRDRSGATAEPGEPGELAVSWRRSRFELVSSRLHRVTYETRQGRAPYADRYVFRVTLRARRSGELVSVIDTHLPSVLEGIVRRGSYRNPVSAVRGRQQLVAVDSAFDHARGRWVLGTGDYGFGALAEIDVQPMGGISRMLAGSALSSYAVVGTAGVDPTDTVTRRYSDYALLRRTDLDRGRSEVLGHRTLGAINSDHRPLLAWLALS